jgi:hypothetical protein
MARGRKTGGRPPGGLNKKTIARNLALAAAAANPNIDPLDFMLGMMRAPDVTPKMRLDAAKAAAPFVHGKAGKSSPAEPKVIESRVVDGDVWKKEHRQRLRTLEQQKKRDGRRFPESLQEELSALCARDPHVDRYHEALFGNHQTLDEFKAALDAEEAERWANNEQILARQPKPKSRSPWLIDKLARLEAK